MKKTSEIAGLLGASVLFTLMGQACVQQDTVGDSTRQEMNRQKGIADAVSSEYDQIKGQYSGKYNNSTILLTLDVARTNGTSLVPAPLLIGNLGLTPELFVNNGGKAMTIPYAVTSGQYVSGGDLTLTVMQNGAPTTLHCLVDKDKNLDCEWYLNASTAPSASFSLTPVKLIDGKKKIRARQFGGTYRGSNADYREIKAQFRPFLETQGGSLAVPLVSIVGSFSFDGVNFSFIDSQFDPISSTLAVKINGDNPVEVNCIIKSAKALHCTWIGTHGSTSYEDFDLHKAN